MRAHRLAFVDRLQAALKTGARRIAAIHKARHVVMERQQLGITGIVAIGIRRFIVHGGSFRVVRRTGSAQNGNAQRSSRTRA